MSERSRAGARGKQQSSVALEMIARLAWRDLRSGSRHFAPVVGGIALGVAAVVAVGAAADAVRRGAAREARSLLAADVEVRSTRALSAAAESSLREIETRRGLAETRVTELVAMAASPSTAALVELKAVADDYPFYGAVETTPDAPLRAHLASGPPPYAAVVQEAFLIRMGLAPGDRFTIGRAEFAAVAILRAEPDRAAGAFSLGPRVLVSRPALEAAGLIQPGSRVRYRILLRAPEGTDVEAVRDDLRRGLAGEPLDVTAYPDAQPALRRSLDRLGTYLGLVGLTALWVGGIGVAGGLRAFLAERWDTIAMLKSVGAGPATILRLYVAETLALAALGGFAGAVLGAIGHGLLARLAAPWLPFHLETAAGPWPYARGLAMGVLTALLFSLWPLLQVARQSPAAVFRREVAPTRTDRRAAVAVAVVLGLGLWGLAWWQAGNVRVAALFAGSLLAASVILAAAARGVARLARAAPSPRGLAWRRGLANLHRPGSRTTTVMVSLGAGVTVVLAVALVERAVRGELLGHIPRDAPSVFFIDIQPDQRDGFARVLAARSVPAELVPVVRSRLAAIDGRPVGPEGRPGTKPEDRWYFTREYVLTFAERVPRDNAITAGRWWAGVPAAPEVSVEEDAARHLGVTVGSMLAFDIQGARVDARVTSLRSVQWDNRSANFYVIFAPGALEQAPLTYLAAARPAAAVETALLREAAAAFPNVTAIQVHDILASAARVIERLALAVRAVGAVIVLAGGVVLAGALAATRGVRLREAMIFKALGATRRTVARAFAIEFLLLGAASGVVGAALASALAWAALRFLLEIPWRWDPAPCLLAVAATAAGTVLVGVASTHRLLGKRPFPVLRGA